MRDHLYTLAGQKVVVHQIEHEQDLTAFEAFVAENRRGLAVDTETTGLDLYAPDAGLRLVAFGNHAEAWVVPIERGGRYLGAVRRALLDLRKLVMHNASFDLQALHHHAGIPMTDLWAKTLDTKIVAHLVDPRDRMEGGTGHSLEDLASHYIDPESASYAKALMTFLAAEYNTTKARIWTRIDLDHPRYNLYCGLDAIMTARLISILVPLVPASARDLIPYEHQIAEICASMEQRGFLLDVAYTQTLATRLEEEEHQHAAVARSFGCENVNSTEQVAEILTARGVRKFGSTPTGRRKVDKGLLNELVAGGDRFAAAVVGAKKARKWRTTWVQRFLDGRDAQDRCHASINSLRARTARMSITGIPAQTLPSGDSLIRRCFLADPGHVIASVDYQAQELRVLAALSRDQTMTRAFAQDIDLHLLTARAAFGEHITKEDKERKYAKVVNFGRVYGGGAKTVAEQTGLDLATAKKVVAAFDRRYPQVAAYSRRLQAQAAQTGYITTPVGRRLPVDPARTYSALNYMIQSSSRDVTGRALVRLHEHGYIPYARLPIHDEVLFSLPADKAAWGAHEIADVMEEDMGAVCLATDAEVGKRSWGSLYGAET
ncbi:DNA polymerase [Pseudonocardiaceae bacterium YIM PH 21723]|nr:DNA polymerase [Pseudonocardiaceae bacterium YIM PH 21723]